MSRCPYHAKKPDATVTESSPATDNPPAPTPVAEEGKEASIAKTQQEEGAKDWSAASGDELKRHFKGAYEMVAARAGVNEKADPTKIKALREKLLRLGYSDIELDLIGEDVIYMQGTGSPFPRAAIKAGETVVDLGSGFGLDAIIAASRVGPTGRVIGIDIAAGEVVNALERATARKLSNLDFRLCDMEDANVKSASVDVCTSNGGFCLVGEKGDKEKAFREIFRMLKPGGRMALACTVRTKPLDDSKRWPSCFIAFADVEVVPPTLAKIGFQDVEIDYSNNAAETESADVADNVDTSEQEVKGVTVHTFKHGKYDHLQGLNMDDYFQRVVVFARKPVAQEGK